MPLPPGPRMRGAPNFAERKVPRKLRQVFLTRSTKSAPPRPANAAPCGVLDPRGRAMTADRLSVNFTTGDHNDQPL